MKIVNTALCFMTLGALCAGSALAGSDTAKAKAAGAPLKFTAQTTCPVMGGKIDSAAYTDIQGQRVYHCCGGCSKKLKADPDTYFKKAAAQGVLFQNIQATDPVSGKPIDKKFESYFEGRRLYFADAESKAKFDTSPRDYLAKMAPPTDSEGTKDSHK